MWPPRKANNLNRNNHGFISRDQQQFLPVQLNRRKSTTQSTATQQHPNIVQHKPSIGTWENTKVSSITVAKAYSNTTPPKDGPPHRRLFNLQAQQSLQQQR